MAYISWADITLQQFTFVLMCVCVCLWHPLSTYMKSFCTARIISNLNSKLNVLVLNTAVKYVYVRGFKLLYPTRPGFRHLTLNEYSFTPIRIWFKTYVNLTEI